VIHQAYTYNNAIPGSTTGPVQDQAFPSTTLLGAFISRLPYAYSILDQMMQRNPKYRDFKGVEPRRKEMIQDQSVFLNDPELSFGSGPGTPGALQINKDYQAFIYANVDKDKTRRLTDYRRMAAFAELADCIDEICDECIVKDENDNITQFNLRGNYTKEVKDAIEKEYKKFITIFDLEDKGWEYFRQFLIDGELYFENIIDDDKRDLGIFGLVSIPSELINPVYQNVQNELVKGFLIRKPVVGPATSMNRKDQEELFFMNKAQVSYINSGIWNEYKSIRLPFIENAKRAYRQLSLIEDSIVIYRLVRAPERLRFTIYTGSMPPPKAEAYLKRLMQSYWTKKNYDTTQGSGGRVTNVYDPQSMLDAYWFTKDAQGNGSTVDTLPAGCLAMDTNVPLLDGRTLTISEIAKEYEAGKQNWIYSTDPATGKIVPGKVSWAGITQKSAQVMELIFDNNEKLICTPDHKFPILGKGKTEAKDLVIGDSIIPFNVRNANITKNSKASSDYQQIYQNDTKEWQFTHKMVVNELDKHGLINEFAYNNEGIERSPKQVIHHKDCWRFNNSPENLVWMNKKEHTAYHAALAPHKALQVIKENDPDRYNTIMSNWSNKVSKKAKERCNTPEFKRWITDRNYEMWSNPELKAAHIKRNIERWSNPDFAAKAKHNMSLHYTTEAFKSFIDVIKVTGLKKQKDIVNYLNNNPDNAFTKQFLIDNTNDKIWSKKYTLQTIKNMVYSFGYTNYASFRKDYNLFNHRVKSIKYLDKPIEVGTLTIDAKEEYHNYHTFALSCGVFTYNSNLGELQDLEYFLKKLYNSLKVPTSRFMQQDTPFKDGAEITRDELRFARFIIRIQRQFAMGIRDTFIAHLKMKGFWKQYKLRERSINIEFNVPTSFMAMRELQLLQIKFDNFNTATQNASIAPSYAQKYYLQWSDEMMKENREWIRKDAGLRWEIAQIEASGPNFREVLEQQLGVAPEGGAEISTAGGVGASSSEIPSFGGTAPVGEAPPEGGTPGAEAGAGAPPEAGPPTQATGASTPSTPPA